MAAQATITEKLVTVKLFQVRHWRFIFSTLLIVAGIVGQASSIAPATAEEPVDKFLDALRERGYFDVAIDYLNSLENSDRVSGKVQQRLSFEKAQLLIDQAATLRNSQAVDDTLNEAQALIDRYAKQANTPELLARVLQFRGNLLLSRARISDYQAKSDRLSPDAKDKQDRQTRKLLEESTSNYREAREKLRQVLKNFQIDPEDPSSTETLKKLRADYTTVRVRIPMLEEQLADTFPDNDPQRAKLLKQAADESLKLFDQYRRYQAGLEACLVSARCNQKLGQHKQAVRVLEDIFSLSRDAVFRSVKRRGYAIAVGSWRKTEPYPWQEVVNRLQTPVGLINREESLTADWLDIQLELARALQAKSEYVRQQDGPTASRDAKELARSAAKLARNVSKVPGVFRDRAVKLLDSLDVDISAESIDEPTAAPPETTTEALAQGKAVLPDVELLLGEVSSVRRAAAKASSADEKSATTKSLNRLYEKINTKTDKAIQLFDMAIGLAGEDTLREDINTARYLQSYCYYARRQYLEATIIANFLLERFPNLASSRQAAKILVKSYSRILQSDKTDAAQNSFERGQLIVACEKMVELWPGSPEAALGAGTLARLGLSENDYAAAESWYQKIPANDPNRAALAVSLGRGIWFDYLKAKKAAAGTNDSAPDKLAQQLNQAKQYLVEGVGQAGTNSITYDVALGALLLVDAQMETGNVKDAVQQLESASVAPLRLVTENHPAITNHPRSVLFRSQTFKTAIKTYLAAMRAGSPAEQQQWIRKASDVIKAMKASMPASAKSGGRQQLTEIYRLIASELTRQFEQLSTPADRSSFATSLRTFLGAIEKDSQDARTLLWSGSTLLSVAETLAQDGATDQATPLFDQAVSALNRAEEIGFKNDDQATQLSRELKRQRALAQRGAGKFDVAIGQLAELLKVNPNDLTMQLDAAETLHMKAADQKQAEAYAAAMMGAEPYADPKTKRTSNAIWGWRRLVQATRRNEKFKAAFYRSLYHLVESRYQYGVLENSDKALASARTELGNAMQRDPDFGGSEWKTKFEALKERIK